MEKKTNKTKKTKQAKSKRTEKETVATIQFIHKKKGRRDMFHLRAKVRGKWLPCGTFYPKIGWRSWSILPRGEREGAMLQLQYQFGRQSIYLQSEAWGEQEPRTVLTQATSYQVVGRGLPIKDRVLYKIK